ncbi:hypothetical protein CsatA_004010 [Cannabis sativa]
MSAFMYRDSLAKILALSIGSHHGQTNPNTDAHLVTRDQGSMCGEMPTPSQRANASIMPHSILSE